MQPGTNNEGKGMQPAKLDDRRAQHGLPEIGEESELQGFNYAQVNIPGEGDKPVTTTIDQRNSNNKNDHLPWLMTSAILGAVGTTLSIVLLLLCMVVGPKYLEALADSRAAKAVAIAELARSDASVAKDYVDQDKSKIKAQLKAEMEKQK